MNTESVKVYDFRDLAEEFAKLMKMKWCNQGAWNAPKDEFSFDIIRPTSVDDCHVTQASNRWHWYGHLNPCCNRNMSWMIDPNNDKHFLVQFHDVKAMLVRSGILTVNELVLIVYEW